MAREDARVAAEFDHCRRETERLQLAARLASLAATAEYRTRGSVVVRRLPPTHPQHARCLRAATENVRPGFFSGESPYSAVRVLDIYKVRLGESAVPLPLCSLSCVRACKMEHQPGGGERGEKDLD